MNQIQVIGRINAPEKKLSKNNVEYWKFSIVSNVKDRGEEISTWYQVTVFQFNEKFMNCLKKGGSLIVNGVLGVPSIYQDRMGVNQVSLSIVANSVNFLPFSEKKPDSQYDSKDNRMTQGSGQAQASSYDEDLPF